LLKFEWGGGILTRPTIYATKPKLDKKSAILEFCKVFFVLHISTMCSIIFMMSKIDKKLKDMKANPRNDWRIEDLCSLAKRYNIDYRQPGTSHVTFSCWNGTCLTVPAHKPIKAIYIKKFIEMIEGVQNEQRND
jgi:hypothetical protein